MTNNGDNTSIQQRPSSDKDWQQLKAQIERRVALKTERIELGERVFDWFRVENPDQLLDQAVSDSELPAEELDPFWSVTWRAAQGLDRFLSRLDIVGRRILELGCGSGQAGVGAAQRGAVVTLTDAVPLALQVAELNAWPVRERASFQILKWGCESLGERFPIILGSDLVYDPSHFVALEACARQHLAPHGRLLLSEPYRHTGDKFSTWILDAGWKKNEHDVDLGDGRIDIRVFECWLEGA